MADLVATLAAALPPGTIVPGEAVEPRYLGDWMLAAPAARPLGLARPRTTAEIATILAACDGARVPVVAQGGRTGLAGGATPADGWLVLSLERMRDVGAPDRAAGTIVAEAGAPLETVQQAADAADLLFPLDIGGRGSCTIGGNIATNAGGNRVLRYGMMRALVLGLEAVLADGTVLTSMNTMLKNNAGYDLKQLFIGSEGTLGVVTRAVLRLFPKPRAAHTALCAVADQAGILALLDVMRDRLGATLAAFEVMWPDFYTLATAGVGRRAPLAPGAGAYVLVETMGADPDADAAAFEEAIAAALATGAVQDAVLARSLAEARALWDIRDASGEFPKTFWPQVGFDVSLPIGEVARFMETCATRLAAALPGVRTVWFGHLADSNLHLAVRVPDVDPQPVVAVDDIVYDCVGACGGSISAEHGIGLLKKPYLDRSRTPAEIATMQRLKRALDPNGILNPGKVFG